MIYISSHRFNRLRRFNRKRTSNFWRGRLRAKNYSKKGGFLSNLFTEKFSVKDGNEIFSGTRNKITGKTNFSVRENGRLTDAWTRKTSHSRFISNLKPEEKLG